MENSYKHLKSLFDLGKKCTESDSEESLDESLKAFLEIINKLENLELSDKTVSLLEEIGIYLYESGLAVIGITYCTVIDSLLSSTKYRREIYNNLIILSYSHESLLDYKEQLKILKRILTFLNEEPSSIQNSEGWNQSKRDLLIKLGQTYRRLNIFHEAISVYSTLLDFSEKNDDLKGKAIAYYNLARCFIKIHRYDEVLDHLNSASQLSKKIQDHILEDSILYEMASFFYIIANYSKAEPILDDLLNRTNRQQDELYYAFILTQLSLIYSKTNRNKIAIKNAYEARDIFSKHEDIENLIWVTYHLAGYIELENDFEGAMLLFDSIIQNSALINNNKVKADCILNIGTIYFKQHEYKQAIVQFKESKQLYQIQDDIQGVSKALTYIGYCNYELSKYKKASRQLKEAYSLWEIIISNIPDSGLRLNARKPQRDCGLYLIKCLLKINDYKTALMYIEMGKSSEIIVDTPEIDKDPSYSNTIQDIVQLKEQLSRALIRKEIPNNKIDLKQIEYEIAKLHNQIEEKNRYRLLKYNQDSFFSTSFGRNYFKKFSKRMKPRWLIIYYYLDSIDSQYIIFLIEKNISIRCFHQPFSLHVFKEINSNVSDVLKKRRVLTSIDEAEELLKNIGPKLWKLLIPPELDAEIRNLSLDYLTIIPTLNLHRFPLELLYDGQDYWGLKYAMSRSLNLRLLFTALDEKDFEVSSQALIVGNPAENMLAPASFFLDEESKGLIDTSLPKASEEANEISEILQTSEIKTTLLLEKDASVSKFISKLNSLPIGLVYFTGHAFFNEIMPDLSYLLLHENNSPIKLHAIDIPTKIWLKGKPLVILSACESGTIYSYLGDEVFGLVRSFFIIGASGVINTGWRIPSSSSRHFFTSFIKYRYQKQNPPAEAFRIARKIVRNTALNSISLSNGEIENLDQWYPECDFEFLHWAPYRFYGVPF